MLPSHAWSPKVLATWLDFGLRLGKEEVTLFLQKVSIYKIMFLNPLLLKCKILILQRGLITCTLAIALFLN